MDWIDYAIRLGIPLLILTWVAIFFAQKVWPFITEQWKQSVADRRETDANFLAALDKRDQALQNFQTVMTSQMAQQTQQMTQRMAEVTDALNKLRNQIDRKPRNDT